MSEVSLEKSENASVAEEQVAEPAGSEVQGDETKSEKPPAEPATFAEKLCFAVTLTAGTIAMLYASGLFGRFGPVMTYLNVMHPIKFALVLLALGGLMTYILAGFVPGRVRAVAHVPLTAMMTFCAFNLWYNTLDGDFIGNATFVTISGMVAVAAAAAAFSFCVAYHDRTSTNSGRFITFGYFFPFIYTLALIPVLSLGSAMSAAQDEVRNDVGREVDAAAKVVDLLGIACPVAYSADYCGKLKAVIDSPEHRKRR